MFHNELSSKGLCRVFMFIDVKNIFTGETRMRKVNMGSKYVTMQEAKNAVDNARENGNSEINASITFDL